ncbi:MULTISPECIES: hypothetical protein [Pseudomonas]|uniref:hypothetical protein n=1 Tax=Pseudomonas TaxID=286 RepID=UPI00301B7664
MTISVSQPLKRHQADAINDARSTVSKVSAALASSAFKPVGPVPAAIIGASTYNWANRKLGKLHAGDVLVHIEAQVRGGIGPQHTNSSFVIKV